MEASPREFAMNARSLLPPRLGAAVLFLAAISCSEARGIGRWADLSIIDRETGETLTPQHYRGEYWVAGKPGDRYAIEVHNRAGERLLAVTSVDGVNVLSGATASWDQNGYVFDAGEHYQITGWRKSDAEVAAFRFSDASNSYAERTGRPADVGVIGIAVFRERTPGPPVISNAHAPEALEAPKEGGTRLFNAPLDRALRYDASTPSPSLPAPKLGTAHGEIEGSFVNHTVFDRSQREPDEILRIHYDSLERLIAMGIFARPLHPSPLPDPFPGSRPREFVPDPPG
jgi:hypothetical protein